MLIERLMKVALLGSEWVLYLLIALSILSLGTMFERWLFFRRHSGDLQAVKAAVLPKLDAKDLAGALRVLEGAPGIPASCAQLALRWAKNGADVVQDVAEVELSRQRKELERGLNLLGTLGNNAPFVGLLGTVLGVIIAFDALGDAGQNTGAMGGVMAGIAEALVATGVGLFVALPAVVAYNVIQKRIGDIESDTQALVKLLVAFIKAYPELRAELTERAPSPEDAGSDSMEAAALTSAA